MDLEADGFSQGNSVQGSIPDSLNLEEACLFGVTEVGTEKDQAGTVIDIESANMNNKRKAKEIAYDLAWQNQVKDVLVKDLADPTSMEGSLDSVALFKSSTSESLKSVSASGSHSDTSCHDNNNKDDNDADDDAGGNDDDNDDDDAYDYDENDDYMYDDDNDDGYDNDYLSWQAQLDNEDLPPGVEVSVPWLKSPAPTAPLLAASCSSTFSSLHAQSSVTDVCAGEKASSSIVKQKEDCAGTSGSVLAESNADVKDKDHKEDEVMGKFQVFKRFDTVENFTDHHFTNASFGMGEQPPKGWVKKIQEEWKILEKDLPDTIYVRVCESRMDLLRAAIVGPPGTPYHDGIFFFDVLFPSSYPSVPPMVYYYSGGLRLNPNLYDCGKVCLSLLNTWNGQKTEVWLPETSTMLQVLVSIQALILNSRPFFNEPGYETTYVGDEGEKKSEQYNEDIFILSLKTMLYTVRRPPKHFEDFVAGHFRDRAHKILFACKAYINGAKVGSEVEGVENANNVSKRSSKTFKAALSKMMKVLITSFTKNGSCDCEQFQLPA